MPRIRVEITVIDDAGQGRLSVAYDEPSRIDMDRDPLYVFARVQGLVQRALDALHLQALQLDGLTDRGAGAGRSGSSRTDSVG